MSNNGKQTAKGFTLIEIAMAIFIITLLLGSILVPLQNQVESRKFDETQKILDQAREGLIGFAAANGYFPCPASSTSNGAEAGANHTTGSCSATGTNTYVGFLPAATLGFTPTDTQGYAVDAWGTSQLNRIRYAVANQTINSVTNPFTKSGGMRSALMSNITAATNMLYVCNSGTGVNASGCNTATPLTSNAIAVIWSLGPNAATTGGTSTDELENTDNDRIFVWHTKSGITGSEFDDIVTWISPNTLFNRLIAAGQLP